MIDYCVQTRFSGLQNSKTNPTSNANFPWPMSPGSFPPTQPASIISKCLRLIIVVWFTCFSIDGSVVYLRHFSNNSSQFWFLIIWMKIFLSQWPLSNTFTSYVYWKEYISICCKFQGKYQLSGRKVLVKILSENILIFQRILSTQLYVVAVVLIRCIRKKFEDKRLYSISKSI